MRFSLPFDWADADPAHSYALRARVVREGFDDPELFATATDTAVITRGHPRRLDLLLVAVAR